MGKYHDKKDRTARLLKLQILLAQYPEGVGLADIAKACSISCRTVYRDLKTLDAELGVPVWMNGGKYGVAEGYFLPPIPFTNEEAMNIFLAIRLMQNLSYSFNPSIASTFMKLNTIVPFPLRQNIQNTLEYMKKQPLNENKLNIFKKLTQAWLLQHIVRIKYVDRYIRVPSCYNIEIYFIEPSIHGHSNYIIAYCEEMKKVFPFKMDRIIEDVEISPNHYIIPADFTTVENLGSEWDVNINHELETVKLHFNANVSSATAVTTWHPSQVVETLSDGSVIMTFKVRDVTYFRAWILGWGDEVEVLEPESLRRQIQLVVDSLADIYNHKKLL